MAIQLRRGAYADFDPTKMVPAEVGIVTSGDPNTDDGKAAYVAFSAGNAKRLATVEDIATDLQEATDDAVGQATARAEAAAESVEASAAQIATNTADISDLKADFEQLEPGLSAEAKAALLACFAKVAWVDEHGQDYYDALEEALYADSYPRITAVFDAGGNVIYTSDALSSLKQYTTVTYYETEESAGVILSDSDYTLSGTLQEGQNIITVIYNGKTTTFIVTAVSRNYIVMEQGDISGSTGQDASTPLRIRQVGYMDMDTTEITFAGCPFAASWRDYAWNGTVMTAIVLVRCYDSVKDIVGTVQLVNDEHRTGGTYTLPAGTKYTRLVMQRAGDYTYAPGWSETAVNPLYINDVEYYLKEE